MASTPNRRAIASRIQRTCSTRSDARERGEDRLVEAREQQLELARAREAGEPVEVCRLVRLQPLQQRSGQVQHGGEEVRLLQLVEQGTIDIVQVLAEDAVEVADGLVQVQPDHEAEW